MATYYLPVTEIIYESTRNWTDNSSMNLKHLFYNRINDKNQHFSLNPAIIVSIPIYFQL